MNALILNRLVTRVNTGQGKNIPVSIIVDELPTLYFHKIDRLIGTARSNKVSVTLGFQELPQLEADYGKVGMQKIITTVGNVVSGSARAKETLEWLSNDIFGKVVQVKKGVTIARFTRSEMLEVLGSDYMLLAESKGISGSALIFKHALRNALIPIITVLAPLIVDLMTGSLVVEKIFAIPGVGSLLVNAIQSNDYNVVIALSFIYSAMYIAIMLVVDILYGIIDPRIRLAKKGD